MRSILCLTLVLFTTFVSAQTYLYGRPQMSSLPSLEMLKLEVKGQKFTLHAPAHSSGFKLNRGRDGIYRGLNDFDNGRYEIRISPERETIEFRIIYSYTETDWIKLSGVTSLKVKCLNLDGRQLCIGKTVVTPKINDVSSQVYQINGFYLDRSGHIYFAHDKFSDPVLADAIKGFATLDLDDQPIKCGNGGVCIGDRRLIGNVIAWIPNFTTEVILGFSPYGFIYQKYNKLAVAELAVSDFGSTNFKKIHHVPCNDVSANELNRLFIEAGSEVCQQLKAEGHADQCGLQEVVTEWGTRRGYQTSPDGKSCHIQGVVKAYVRSPLN